MGTIWRRQSGGVRDARSHCSSSWRHYQHVSLLTSCVKILVALVINSIFPTTSWALKTIRHDGQPFYRYLALSSLALDSMTQPFPFCCGNLLSLINFSYFGLRWGMSMTEVLWHRNKRTSWQKNTCFILLILLTVWGFGQQPIWKCQQPLVIERVANWANWAGANSDELWSVASQTFATSTPKTDLLSTEATWSTFEQSKQCEKLQLKLSFNFIL